MTLSQQKKGARIDLFNADPGAPAFFRMAGEDEEKGLVVEFDCRQFGVSRVGCDDHRVEGAVAQARKKPVGQILGQVEGRVRQRLGELREDDRQSGTAPRS